MIAIVARLSSQHIPRYPVSGQWSPPLLSPWGTVSTLTKCHHPSRVIYKVCLQSAASLVTGCGRQACKQCLPAFGIVKKTQRRMVLASIIGFQVITILTWKQPVAASSSNPRDIQLVVHLFSSQHSQQNTT